MFQKILHFLNWYTSQVFTLDVRSLAILRISLGMVTIYNLYTLWPHINDFYGPHGIYPSQAFFQTSQPQLRFSFHALSDHYSFITSLFILHGLLGCLLILGVRTQLVTVLCWLMSLSLYNRLPSVNFGGDSALVTFLMWGIFLPLGAAFSVDQRLKKNAQSSYRISTIAAAGFIIQMAIIYLVSGWSKTSPLWTKDYTALFLIYNGHEFGKPFGSWLTQFPFLLKALTFLTLALERHLILLLFLPFWPSLCRSILISCFIVFHLSIFLTIDVGWFPFIMLAGWAALIPHNWWQRSPSGKPGILLENSMNPLIKTTALALLTFILMWNCQMMQGNSKDNPSYAEYFARTLGLYPNWKMFSPSPPAFEKYFYFSMTTGQSKDSSNNTYISPKLVDLNSFFPKYDDRWKKFLSNVTKPKNKKYIPSFKAFIIYHWNQNHHNYGINAATVRIYYRNELIPINTIKNKPLPNPSFIELHE